MIGAVYVVEECGAPVVHSPHAFPIVHPNAPTVLSMISCKGKPIRLSSPPVSLKKEAKNEV